MASKSLTTNEDTPGTVTLTVTDPDLTYWGDSHTFEIVSAPANGTASISGSTLTFTTAANWNGTTSLTYRAKDAAGAYSAPATVSITVNAVNDAPVAAAKSLTTNEDTAGTVTLTATDIDSPAPTTFEIVGAPANGTASISGSTLTFTPTANWNGSTSLTYRAQDSAGAWSAPATVSITVNAVNDVPVVASKSLTTNEDTPGTVTLTVTDPDLTYWGDSHTFEIVSAPANGTASISGSTLTFTPAANWNGTTSLTYRAKDAAGAYSAPATVSITVNAVNDAPVAAGKSLVTTEDAAGSVTLSATDIDSPSPTIFEIVSAPANGTASISGSTLTFTPAANWNGTTSLTYRAKDAAGAYSAPATVSITVNAVNDAPVVAAKTLTTNEDTAGTVTLTVTDPDLTYWGDSHTFEIVGAPANGTASISGSTLTFTPAANWNGTTSLTYRAKDAAGAYSAPASVSITVNAVNDVPVVAAKSLTTNEDTPGTVTLTVTDPDLTYWGDSHTFEIVGAPANGTASISGSTLTFTPAANWNGTTSLTYRAKDAAGAYSAPASVSITVNAVNDVPVVAAKSLTTNEDTPGTVTLTVTDPDLTYWGDSHTFEIVSAPANGTASISGSTLTFTPAANWNGTTSLTYRARDAAGAYSAPATVSITVNAVNDDPTAADLALTTPEEVQSSLDLLVADVDLQFEGDTHTFELVTVPTADQGSVVLKGRTLTFTPAKDWNGNTSVTYRVKDSHGAVSNTATVALTVTWVNDPPVSVSGAITTNEGMASDHLAPTVVDADAVYGDTFTFSILQNPAHGSVRLVYGRVEYTPDTAYTGPDLFRIRVTDREGASVDGDIPVTVNKFNYAPTDIKPASIDVFAGVGGSAELSVADPNLWGSHRIEVVTQPDHGTVSVSGMTLTYKTDGDTDTSVRLKAIDQDGLSVEKTISLNFKAAWEIFKGRAVKSTSSAPSVPAVKVQMTNPAGAYALQIPDQEVLQALGSEIVAIVTPDSAVGLSLQHRELAPGSGMRLVPTKLTPSYLEARLGGLNVGVDGTATLLLSRADMTGSVYSVPVHVWSPGASLVADTWEIAQGTGRSQIQLKPEVSVCAFLTSESAVKQKNVLQDPSCFVTWTKTPDEWHGTGTLTTLSMEAAGNATGAQTVQATAYVYSSSGESYEIASFTRDLNVVPLADKIHFALKPLVTQAYQNVEDLSLVMRQTDGVACDLTVSEIGAKKSAEQWQIRPICLIRWMSLPDGLAQTTRMAAPELDGVLKTLGTNLISWKASVFTPSGVEVDIGYGSQEINALQPPAIEIELPTTNVVKEGMYWVSQLGGLVGASTTLAIPASVTQVVTRNEEEIESNVYPNYGRSQRITHYIEGAEAPLWSVTPYTIDAAYTAYPSNHTQQAIQLLAVPHDQIVPVILNGEDQVLDTESLTVNVAIQDTRFPTSAYNVATMGDWDIRLMMSVAGADPIPVSDWEPINSADGTAQFEMPLDTLTNKVVRLTAEARVRSPVPEYSLIRESSYPLVLSVLNGAPLDSSIQAMKVIGPAPLRSSFYAMTNDRYESRDMGDVRWEMSSDGGVTWNTVSSSTKLSQRLTWTFERGSYLLRAEVTNRNSGAKSMTPTIEVIAYIVPQARMKGPANVFMGDYGTFRLTDLQGGDLNTDGMVIEWSEDRGKTWIPGDKTYRLTRDTAQRVYLTARLKYSDSPEDKRVYKILRAGVSFREVRPPRVQIIGPRRPEVGKEATWTANLMMPYPNMDLTMDGVFILPNGEEVHSNEVKYTPTVEDRDREKSYIGVRAWINGYEDKGGIGLTQSRLLFWEYLWPEWTIQTKFSAIYAPAELTMTARSLGLFREFEGLKMEWDIPPYAGLTMIKDSNEVMRILNVAEPGTYTFGVHISDARGNYSYVEKSIDFLEPIPWNVKLSWSGDNDANRAPLGVLIRPTITGGHPKDRVLSRVYSLDGQVLPSSGDYGRALLESEGTYTVSLDIQTEMGYTASGSVDIPVNANLSPACTLSVTPGRTSWLAKASCTDQDGVIARYIWFVNGQQQSLSSSSISVPTWRYPDGEPVITVVGVDDSGAESPPVSSQ